jgi:hypothetical protein
MPIFSVGPAVKPSWKVLSIPLAAIACGGFVAAAQNDAAGKEDRKEPPFEMVQGSKLYKVLPKDAIPAIDEPTFVKASDAIHMDDSEPVMGVEIGSPPKAYPLYLLDHHEIVNDTVGGRAIAATW